jgi:hypothetical protein
MAIIGLFQYDPWCLPTQKWLKNATNDISIQEFHNVTRHYVKDTALYVVVQFSFVRNLTKFDPYNRTAAYFAPVLKRDCSNPSFHSNLER